VDVVRTPWLNILDETSKPATRANFYSIYVAADLPEAGVMLQQRYHSSTANTWMQNELLLDPKLDSAIDDALATTDQAARIEKYKALQHQVMDYVPSLYLYDWLWKQAYRADRVDWHPEQQSTVLGYTFFMPRIGVHQ
jgi:ABC-type transport system substrate-binding protein